MKRCNRCGTKVPGEGFCNLCGWEAGLPASHWAGFLWGCLAVFVVIAIFVVGGWIASLGPPDTSSCHYHYDHSYQDKGDPHYDIGEDAYCAGF